MAKRTLTSNEKSKILATEQKMHPDAKITVLDETDNDGAPKVIRQTIKEMPSGWTPDNA